jgi:hypothetical protein
MICRCVAGLTSYVVCVDVVNKVPAPQAYTGRATSNDIVRSCCSKGTDGEVQHTIVGLL